VFVHDSTALRVWAALTVFTGTAPPLIALGTRVRERWHSAPDASSTAKIMVVPTQRTASIPLALPNVPELPGVPVWLPAPLGGPELAWQANGSL
jgi:hypothetical protein